MRWKSNRMEMRAKATVQGYTMLLANQIYPPGRLVDISGGKADRGWRDGGDHTRALDPAKMSYHWRPEAILTISTLNQL